LSAKADFATVSKNVAAESEPSILALIQAGIDANAAPQAASLARDWLRQNVPTNPAVLYHAARASELAGDPDSAAALYQQFLRNAEPTTPEASDAITAVHTLLIDYLSQPDFAYSFARTNTDRLAVNPAFRQWDTWFLAEARRRNDAEALASRLLATLNAKSPADLIIAFHDDSLAWLLTNIRSRRYDIPDNRIPDSLLTTVISLATAVSPFDPEYAFLLHVTTAIRAYNMARLDGVEMAPPIGEAKALLDHYPQHALLIQTEWAGGSNSPHYREDITKYYPHLAEQKFAPILAALPKLAPLAQTRLIESWNPGHYSRGPEIMTLEALRDFVIKNPTLINHKAGPNLSLQWEKLTLDEAAKLAPVLTQNPSTEATRIHAIIAAGEDKDLGKAIDAVLGPESWRLTPDDLNGRIADRLWHWAGRPGGNERRDQEIARSREIAESSKKATTLPPEQRPQAIRQLLNDLKSNRPKTPAILSQIQQLLASTPDSLADILRDGSPVADMLARNAITNGFIGPDGRKIEDSATWTLEPVLRAQLAKQLESGPPSPWLVTEWLARKFPEPTEEQPVTEPQEFFTKLATSPKWAALPTSIHRAARRVFGESALTPAQLTHFQAADPKRLCQPLLDLPEAADAPTIAAALEKTLTNLAASPVRRDITGLERLDAADPAIFADPQVLPHLLAIAHPYRSFAIPPVYGQKFFTTLRDQRDPAALSRSAAYLWRHVQIQMRDYPTMITFIGTLADDHPAALVPLAAWMRPTIARHKHGHTFFNREDFPTIDAMRGRALTALGLITIPVPPTHPAYPVYQAQSDWVIGNEDSAWKSLDENWDAFIETHRVLSLDFLMWAVELTVISGDRDRQETLVTSMVTWAAEEKSPLSINEKARVEIALGDVALQRGQVTQAEQIFTRIQENEAYLDTPQRNTAALRRIRSLLAAKDHDGALEIITDLDAQRIPGLWAPLRLARAEVFFDMERFADAGDDVRSVLQREPDNADALLLLGQVQIKNRRYIEASALEIGSATESPYLVPGENLKVTLNDPGLAISGSGIDIEVVVWTTADDRETFFLRRFGDEKTRFRGEIPTSLGPPTPGDGTLQVTGSDEVFYAYSEEFRRRVNLEEEMRGGPITVASDAMLMASARQLLTAAEQRIADLEAEISTGENVNLADLDPATRARLASQATEPNNNAAAQATVVKPGNPVHVRVIDPDRSRTTSPDELIVSAATSSGDSIASITLRETGPHTGWFEGSIPTAPAPPVAFSPKSEPGRNPNSVISPRDDYPAWQPIAEANAVHEFVIDLNDRAALGEMTLTTPTDDGRITRFALQTANRHGAWQTVARHPATPTVPEKFWHPTVTVVRQDGDRALRNPRDAETPLGWLQEHLDREAHLRDEQTIATTKNVSGIAEAFPADIPELLGQKDRNNWQNLGVVHRFTAWFHEPEDTTRRFDFHLGKIPQDQGIHIRGGQQNVKAGFILTINGRQIAATDANKLEGEINLRPGLHRLDLWAVGFTANIGYGRPTSLRANLDPANPTAMVECLPTFFDPANFPSNILERTNGSATITPSDSGDAFTIAFAPDSQARLIRLLLPAYQGPAPAINRITLNSKDGQKILPTAADYATLRQNETLEILPDDTISVRYTDDRPVSRNRDQHERFLRAAYTDATLEFADIEPRFNEYKGEYQPFYERLLRFRHGEPLSIVVRDGDMDTTPQPDTLTLTLQADGGSTSQFTATETGPATGIFRLLVTPTPEAPTGENEFQIPAGGTLTVTYLDRENTRPGVPTERIANIEHAEYATPVIHLAHATVKPLDAVDGRNQAITHGFSPRNDEPNNNRKPAELVRTRWQIDHQWQPAATPPESGIQTVHGRPLAIKIDAPHLALRANSAIKVYAQTSSGRRAAGQSNATFDINTPGTIEIEAALRSKHGHISPHHPRAGFPEIPIYTTTNLAESEPITNTQSLVALIPLIADSLPPYGVVTEEERKEMILQAADSRSFTVPSANRTALVVRPGDTIHIGIQSTDPAGKTTWLTATATVITHPVFDILEDDAREPKTAAYVGETLNLRVIDLGADLTDAPDTIEVLLQAKSGARTRIELRETGPHTGIFTARPTLGFTENGGPLAEDHNVRQLGFPVTYGDTVASRYTAANGLQTDIATVTISKGADGALTPFSKTYDDPETAMRTQFSLAEAYLELSRRYRQLNEISLADQNAITARQLLASVADQFTDADTRAHAEYLLGQLTLQEALVTEDPATKELRFRAALSRFMTVTGSFPDTLHASNAQFRIATIYEALGENDVAAQEYVKLAYKYPQSEFLATSMGRLGSHFLRRASEYEEKSKTLLAQAEATGDKDAEHQGTAMAKMAEREYLNTARIFGRLSDRFPSHELSAQAGLRAGQAYMRANQHRDAVNTFLNVANNTAYDGPDVRAQAMYWAGMNYQSLREEMAAFAIYQRITYDFPESQWAAFARGQLSQERMLNLETELELQRLEAGP
jgi:outer membrane protein assembly factor BamD (BamD/ComL family)